MSALAAVLGLLFVVAVLVAWFYRVSFHIERDMYVAQKGLTEAQKAHITALERHADAAVRASELDDAYVRAVRNQYGIPDGPGTPKPWLRSVS